MRGERLATGVVGKNLDFLCTEMSVVWWFLCSQDHLGIRIRLTPRPQPDHAGWRRRRLFRSSPLVSQLDWPV